MDRDTALLILTRHKQEFKKMGVKSLALFGSTARNEATDESDVDLLVEFEGPATFDGYMDTKFFLEDILKKPVDLVLKETLKTRIRPYIEREAINVA